MNDSIILFSNPQFGQIRVDRNGDDPSFVAADICRALDIKNASDAIKRLDEDEKGIGSIYTHGGVQSVSMVNEYGLYNLVLASRKPEAKAFKRWITHEVIPSIRKDGGYMVARQDESEADLMARALLIAQHTIERQHSQISAMQPKVIFADAVSVSQTDILVGDLAKLIKQNGIDIGANRLFQWMRENGYLIKRNGSDFNMPTQYSMEQGWFSIKETVISHSDGHTSISKTPKVTGKGQVYFVNKFLSGGVRS